MDTPRNLNPRFRDMLEDELGLAGLADVLESTQPDVSVRLRADIGESCPPAVCARADGRVPWCKEGIYLSGRPSFTRDPAMHQGRYYVQDASSMFIGHVLRELAGSCPHRLLDACAAPGGKTTAAYDALPAGSLVVANEIVPARAAVLKENIIKQGCDSAIVTRADTAAFRKFRGEFDIVLIDAPCSGEGMMRKEPRAVEQWSEGLITECEERQREIVGNLWDTLTPGGYLIYSTCTFNLREDERMVEHIMAEYGAESVVVETDPRWGIYPAIGSQATCYRFLPGRVRGEGLFMAVLRKPLGETPRKKQKPEKVVNLPNDIASRLKNPHDFALLERGDNLVAFPKEHLQLLRAIERSADVIHCGIVVGEKAGRDFAPTQSLALSRAYRRGSFPEVDVDEATALEYLRRNAVTLPVGTPRGYVLLTFEQQPLGFVKNIGNRANNLYPSAWRILSTH